MKALFVSMPPTYKYEKMESREYRSLRDEYFRLYEIIRTNTTLKNVDKALLPCIDNLHSFNYALLSFISIAKREGIQTKYYAPGRKNWLQEFSQEFKSFRPDIVYIGCSHSTSFIDMEELISRAKELDQNIRIVAGGQYLTGLQRPIKDALLVKGEGFLPFYWTLHSEEPFRHRIITRSDVPGSIVKSFHAKYEEFPYPDIDSYHLNVMPVGRIYFQLGCINKERGHEICKFCGSLSRKEIYLSPDPERVVSILDRMVKKLKTQHVFIGDESFFSSYENAEKIISALEKYVNSKPDLNLSFSVQARLEDFLLSTDLFERFASIGLVEVHFGIESSSQGIIDCFGGKLKSVHICKALKLVKEKNVFTLCHFLTGLPGETRHSMQQDTALIESLSRSGLLNFPEFRYVAYYPGAEFYCKASEYGIKITQKNPELVVPEFEQPNFELDTISNDAMVRLLHDRYKKTNTLLEQTIRARNYSPRMKRKVKKVLF